MNQTEKIAQVLAEHVLLAGDGYHRTRRCTFGWTTRTQPAIDVHRAHVAEAIQGVIQ